MLFWSYDFIRIWTSSTSWCNRDFWNTVNILIKHPGILFLQCFSGGCSIREMLERTVLVFNGIWGYEKPSNLEFNKKWKTIIYVRKESGKGEEPFY